MGSQGEEVFADSGSGEETSTTINGQTFSANVAAVHAVEQALLSSAGAPGGIDADQDSKSSFLGGHVQMIPKDMGSETNVVNLSEFTESAELAMNPVTRIASDYVETMYQTVAVNDEFITYGLKQGHIRVLHRYSEARALLKGHTGPVAHVCFVSSDIIAAGGTDGKLFVWKVVATEDENALQVDILMSAVFSPGCEMSAVAVTPVNSSDDGEMSMVVSVGNAVMLMQVPGEASNSLLDIDPLDPLPYGKRIADFPLQDEPKCISTSGEGRVLAIGSQRGRVYVGTLSRQGNSWNSNKLINITIGDQVDGVDWVSEKALMVSTKNGCCKRLYSWSGQNLEFAEELTLYNDPSPYIHTSCVAERQIACLADTRNKSVYLMTFDLTGHIPHYRLLAKFSVGKPILSIFACWNLGAAEEGRGGLELNCVQTDAVQQYYIDTELYRSEEQQVETSAVDDTVVDDAVISYTTEEVVHAVGQEPEEELEEPSEEGTVSMEEPVTEHSEEAKPAKLLTPSDIISSSKGKESSQIKILKRGEKINVESLSMSKTEEPASSYEQNEDEEEEEDSMPSEIIGDGSAASIFAMIKKEMQLQSTKQTKSLEAILKSNRKYMDDQMTKMSKSLDKKITAQVKSEIKALQAQLTTTLQASAKESIRTILPKEVMGAVKTSLDKQLSNSVQQGLAKPIQESFKQSFLKQIVPAFESACQTMFSQLDQTLTLGIKEHSESFRASFSEALDLTRTLKNTIETAKVISEDLSHGQGASELGRTHSSSTVGSLRSPKSHDYKQELTGMIQAGQFDQAFSKALSLQDLSLVGWLCSNVDAPSVMSSSPNALSQMVLLSLLQQLAADLSHGTSSKLQWIREAAMAINPTDHTIASHIRPVLEQVAAALTAVLPRLQPSEASSCKLTLHVVRSQMSS
jgi:hypothetical protein